MYRFLRILLSLGVLIISSSFNASAQQQTGCLLPAGTLHYQENGTSGGKTNYDTNPSIPLTSVYCVATVAVNPNCRVNKKTATANQGTKRTFYLVNCPLDDYLPLFIIVISGLSFFMIRSRKATLYEEENLFLKG